MDRPPTPEQHLWSSILDSVSSSRAIPSKNVILLGEPWTGKTTLANALLQKSSSDIHNQTNKADGDRSAHDFAVGYEWADVKDEAEEDTLARLSVYSVPSSSPAHLSLLPLFVPPKTALVNSLVMIVLDWTRPWTFLDQLHTWLTWVEKWSQGDGARELEVLRDEGRERLQSHLQHYNEPSSTNEPVSLPGGNSLASTLLPLPQGAFTHNPSGVPIVVVCTKADSIDQAHVGAGLGGMGAMKAKGSEWEERTDTIMQVMRTICMKYGASLFYTSQSQPVSLTQLRAYTLHLLFMPPPPPADTPPLKYLFSFKQRPNLLDRDRIVVPAGWDSWGKIGVVRDGFECNKWSDAWERDLEGGVDSPGGATMLFKRLVGAEDLDKRHSIPPLITTEPEQAFLARHFESLSKDQDPRNQFRQAPNPGDHHFAGVVGPMGATSFSSPNVDKAMTKMETEDINTTLARLGTAPNVRRDRPGGTNVNPVATSVRSASGASMNGTANQPSPVPGSASAKSQHEVLETFFNKLLKKGRAGGPEGASVPHPPTAGETPLPAPVPVVPVALPPDDSTGDEP